MFRLLVALVASQVLLAGPVRAEAWDAYYNMATFGAGGGSDAGGWFNFECADEESGFGTAGQAHFSLRMGEDFTKEEFVPVKDIQFWVGDGKSFVLPMSPEADSAIDLKYDYSAETRQEMLWFIEALRQGDGVSAWSDDRQLARVALKGSSAALKDVEACVAGED